MFAYGYLCVLAGLSAAVFGAAIFGVREVYFLGLENVDWTFLFLLVPIFLVMGLAGGLIMLPGLLWILPKVSKATSFLAFVLAGLALAASLQCYLLYEYMQGF